MLQLYRLRLICGSFGVGMAYKGPRAELLYMLVVSWKLTDGMETKLVVIQELVFFFKVLLGC